MPQNPTLALSCKAVNSHRTVEDGGGGGTGRMSRGILAFLQKLLTLRTLDNEYIKTTIQTMINFILNCKILLQSYELCMFLPVIFLNYGCHSLFWNIFQHLQLHSVSYGYFYNSAKGGLCVFQTKGNNGVQPATLLTPKS